MKLSWCGVVLVLVMLAVGQAAETGQYGDAYRDAKQNAKPLVVLITSAGCAPCQQMKATVVPELAQRGVLDEVAFCILDFRQDAAIVRKLGQIRAVPHTRLYRYRRGSMAFRKSHTGFMSADQITEWVK